MNQADQTTINFVGDDGESILSTEGRSSSTGPMVGSISAASSTSSEYSVHEIESRHNVEGNLSTNNTAMPIEDMDHFDISESREIHSKPHENDEPHSPPKRISPTTTLQYASPTAVPTEGGTSQTTSEEVSPKVNRGSTQPRMHMEPVKHADSIVSETPVNFDFNPQLMMNYQQILMQQQQHFHQIQQPYLQALPNQQPPIDHQTNMSLQASILSQGHSNTYVAEPKRRAISLRLIQEKKMELPKLEETSKDDSSRAFFFKRPRRLRALSQQSVFSDEANEASLNPLDSTNEEFKLIERGTLFVSWYEGTSSTELQEHVRNSLCRKLSLKPHLELANLRILDESVETQEEIVLSPYIPDGSKFLLRFEIRDTMRNPVKKQNPHSPVRLDKLLSLDTLFSRPPDSPSAAPSPFPSSVNLEDLQKQIGAVLMLNGNSRTKSVHTSGPVSKSTSGIELNEINNEAAPALPEMDDGEGKSENKIKLLNEAPSEKVTNDVDSRSTQVTVEKKNSENALNEKTSSKTVGGGEKRRKKTEKSDDVVAQRLIELNELLLLGRDKSDKFENYRSNKGHSPRQEKKQVIFIIANYFVLFLSIIALSAEFHERAPRWFEWIQTNVTSVQNCAADRDALFECVSNGDFSGLIASLILWASRSAATKRIFLFGFDDKIKLWIVVYESGVTAICWGTSYMFIRRGLNPDTRERFLQKYWKDAVYGSLAGFNAAFMKAVLKNMVPQDQVLDVFEKRQVKIVHFLAQIFANKDN